MNKRTEHKRSLRNVALKEQETQNNLDASIETLRLLRRKLKAIDEETLDKLEPSTQEEWARLLGKITSCINTLETAKLRILLEESQDTLQELSIVTEGLKNDLQNRDNVLHVIQIISSGLKIVTNLADLIK